MVPEVGRQLFLYHNPDKGSKAWEKRSMWVGRAGGILTGREGNHANRPIETTTKKMRGQRERFGFGNPDFRLTAVWRNQIPERSSIKKGQNITATELL